MMSNWLVLLTLVLTLSIKQCGAGDEVLAGFSLKKDDLKANDIAIIQFDTRELADYWEASARWNKAYALYHGHQYAYLTSRERCKSEIHKLSPVWCKVKAMVAATTLLPRAKAFVYLDSDAVMTSNHSLAEILGFIRRDLKWNMHQRPVAFNQDGPGWSCKNAMRLGYKYCLNSGTVFWLNTPEARNIIMQWWESADDSYATSVFKSKWRHRWPWEQAQMYKVYDANMNLIQRLSFPNASFLPWTSKAKPKSQYPTDAVEPWCFSHWPGANCFITHHCASLNQKKKIIDLYSIDMNLKVNYIYIDNVVI
jgi:hypothetical protein